MTVLGSFYAVFAAADQPHLWERYYQTTGAGVQHGSQVGFGLGLHISRAIIEGHHGQVGLESAPGQGTTIWFTLPLAAPRSSASSGEWLPASAMTCHLVEPSRNACRLHVRAEQT